MRASTSGGRQAIYWTVSVGLAAGLLAWSLRGIEWGEVRAAVRHADAAGLAGAAGLISAALLLRAVRWRVLLEASGRVPVGLAFRATAAGYLGNNLLPARAGELVRTVMVSRQSGISKAFVLTTALAERMMDGVALLAVSGLVLMTAPRCPGWLAAAARPFAVLGVAGVATIALLPLGERWWARMLARLPVPEALRGTAAEVLAKVLEALRSLHSVRRASGFLGLTVLIWAIDGVTTMVAARAIGVTIPFPLAMLLIAGLGLASALPSTPGYVGIYQFVAVTVLTPFGLSRSEAIAYILVAQALIYVVVLVWGGLAVGSRLPAVRATAG